MFWTIGRFRRHATSGTESGPIGRGSLASLLAALSIAVSLAWAAADPIAVVSFRWTPGQIEVEVSVNGGAPLWFILDTGAEFSVLDEQLARRLGLALHPRFGRRFARGVALRLGTVEMRNQEVMVLPLDNFRRQRRPIVGLIGHDLFQRYVVSIDYVARTVALHEPRAYRPPTSASSVPLSFADRLATVPVTIALGDSAPLEATVILDTGASQAMILRYPFAESHGLLQRAAAHSTTRAGSLETTTVTFAKLPAERLAIGGFSLHHPVLRLYTDASGAGGSVTTDGALGNEVLRRFTVTFDYSRGRLYLQPNSSLDEPFQ